MSTRVNSCACRHAHAYAVAGLLSKTGARSLTVSNNDVRVGRKDQR